MKRTSWLSWLLALSVICLCEAQYKFRRPHLPPPLPPPQIFKKSWAPGPRIPPMGNALHIGPNYPHKRPFFKPPNYRFRRPPGLPPPPPSSMFNVLPNTYKNPIPPSGLGMLSSSGNGNFPSLTPQRVLPPVKDLQSLAKVPQQYSPQDYMPEELTAISLATQRGGIDDDKGPIHTIPAPNLGPASKSYQQQQALFSSHESKEEEPAKRPSYSVTQVDYASVFNGQDSNVTPQQVLSSNPTTIQHQYEVTESNEVNSVVPTYFTPDFDSAQYASSILQEQQANDVYLSHQSSSRSTQPQEQLIGSSNIADQSASLQANLRSSMHVGSSGTDVTTAGQQTQASDLHVGQPGPAGPPMSAAKLYEVLNAFPQQITDQFSLNQQPQIQQHLLQQQLSQILQQQQQDEQNTLVKASFSQPTLHSFNYDEQANKQKKQQNIFIDQNYASGRVTADYSLAPEASDIAQDVSVAGASEHQENNIEFESPVRQVRPTTYFAKFGDDQSVATQFYTTLPNREAAEKLAALAAAGNVNSQLIGQLRKHQQQKEQQSQSQQQPQSDQPMPANHKDGDEDYQNAENHGERQRHEQRQKPFYRLQKIREEQTRRDEDKYKQQSNQEEKHPLRIMVPEDNVEQEKEVASEDYEYENDEADIPRENEPSSEDTEFGSRIISKNRK